MEKTILVTGVSGFIGSAVASRLLELGYRVVGTVNRNPARVLTPFSDRFTQVKCNLAHTQEVGALVDSIQAKHTLVGIIHIAGLAIDWGPEEKFLLANLDSTGNLITEALNRELKFFIHTSTMAVHGFGVHHRSSTEEGPYTTPVTHYQRTKIASEQLIADAGAAGLPCLTLRPGNVYGPGDTTTLYPILDAIADKKMAYVDGGRHLTNPVYIDDMVQGYERALTALGSPDSQSFWGQAFNITTDEEVSWKDYLQTASEYAELPAPRTSAPAWIGYLGAAVLTAAFGLVRSATPPPLTRYRISQVAHDYHFTVDKARKLLGYQPLVGYKEGLRLAVAGWKANQP